MTELFDTLRSHESNDAHMRDLGRHSHLETLEQAQASYKVALNAVEAVLTECADSPAKVEELLGAARAFKWADRDDPTRLFSGAEELIGEQVAQLIFADNLPVVENYLANETGITAASATDVIQVVSAVSLATGVGTPREEANLAARIGATGAVTPLPTQVAAVDAGSDGSAGSADPSDMVDATGSEEGGAKSELEQRQKRFAIVTAAAVIVAGLFFVVSNGSDDEPVESLAATDSQDDSIEAEPGDSEETTDPDVTGSDEENIPDNTDVTPEDTEEADPLPEDGGEPVVAEEEPEPEQSPIVTYNVPMVDIATPDRDAEGLLGFDFNTETGEVCYRVVSSNIDGPYRTHIHVGGSDEKGGIVVDMGPQESGATGCLENPPADIQAILNDLEHHYAELHDVSEEWTIRGQLSEALERAGAVVTVLQFDPTEDGAYLAIDDGIAILRGEVPNLLTATTLAAHYAPGGSGLVISSELTVNSEAPLPSGRIVLVNHEFSVNSADLPAIDANTEATLSSILSSQEGWKLTAVGRTDSDGSELNNLELSLRRAKSIREYVEGINAFDGSILVRGAGDLGFQGRFLELEFVPQ